jgi:hypothetical protein
VEQVPFKAPDGISEVDFLGANGGAVKLRVAAPDAGPFIIQHSQALAGGTIARIMNTEERFVDGGGAQVIRLGRLDAARGVASGSGGMMASSPEAEPRSAGLILFHCLKKGSSETTRSWITGKFGKGARVTTAESSAEIRVLHARRGTRLIDIAQVPHIPTRQAQRNASEESVPL